MFEHGARILDGSFMNQELIFGAPNSESSSGSESSTVSSVSIADPYVLLRMTDDSIRLLVGGMSWKDEYRIAIVDLVIYYLEHLEMFYSSSLI